MKTRYGTTRTTSASQPQAHAHHYGTEKTEADEATQAYPARSDVDKNTRAYMRQVRACVAIARLGLSLAGNQDDFKASETLKRAADTCDAIRSRLAGMSTKHFDKQATTAWAGVDRIKSGLNATRAYLDSGYPSKLAEAKEKLRLGFVWARIGIRGINLRRHVYGLGSI